MSCECNSVIALHRTTSPKTHPFLFHRNHVICSHPIRSRDVFADYVVWRIVDQFVSAMPQSFGAAKLEYMKAVSGGVTQIRWAQCIVGMTSVFPMPLGYLFVGKKFDEESKKVVRRGLTETSHADQSINTGL